MLDVSKMYGAILKAHDGELPVSFLADGEGSGSWVVEVEPNHTVVLATLRRGTSRAAKPEIVA
ncbi:MAG TPA: hypothetical protein VJ550_08725 [Geomonas sp.]|nr:hypothetical protein [Geomonas sp.]